MNRKNMAHIDVVKDKVEIKDLEGKRFNHPIVLQYFNQLFQSLLLSKNKFKQTEEITPEALKILAIQNDTPNVYDYANVLVLSLEIGHELSFMIERFFVRFTDAQMSRVTAYSTSNLAGIDATPPGPARD
jgi:hypothetical protein